MNTVIQLICAFCGSLGFALYFNVKKGKIVLASSLGLLCWAVYLIVMKACDQVFIASLVAAFVVSMLSEILARKVKAPSMIFYIISIIPLVPGGTLYYLMDAVVKSDKSMIDKNAYTLIWTIIGMGVGTALVQAYMTVWKKMKRG